MRPESVIGEDDAVTKLFQPTAEELARLGVVFCDGCVVLLKFLQRRSPTGHDVEFPFPLIVRHVGKK